MYSPEYDNPQRLQYIVQMFVGCDVVCGLVKYIWDINDCKSYQSFQLNMCGIAGLVL